MTVLWRPGLTLWVDVRAGEGAPRDRLDAVLRKASRSRFDERRTDLNGIARLSYRLDERLGLFKKKRSLHGFAALDDEWLQVVCIFDESKDEAEARSIWESLRRRSGAQARPATGSPRD